MINLTAFLQVVLAILMSISSNPAATEEQRAQAISLATQAVQMVQEQSIFTPDLGTGQSTTTQSIPQNQNVVIQTQPVSMPDPIPAPQPRSISVQTIDNTVVITNTSDVVVRIKNFPLTQGKIINVLLNGVQYSPEFKDSRGKSYSLFACSGLGSLGTYQSSSGSTDPCQRIGGSGVRNELAPGESITLYMLREGDGGDYTYPLEYSYQPGSIVEVATGNDVAW